MKRWISHLPGFRAEAALVSSGNLYGSALHRSQLTTRQGMPVTPALPGPVKIAHCMAKCGGMNSCFNQCIKE